MPRIFTYEENGLSYTVRVYEQDGQVFADITVNSGFMNVNAIYTADSDFSGPSAGLKGPLNMNGGGSQFEGQQIQWDDAIVISQPGLGHQDPLNPTFLQAGETMTVALDAASVEDVDFVGIRATSTSTPDGSIKGVSGNPVEDDDDDNGDDDDDDDDDDHGDDGDDAAIYSKVFFVFDADADVLGGFGLTADLLPEDAEGTFADYVALFEDFPFADIADINTVIFYVGEDLEEAFRLEGPFDDIDALLLTYDEAIQAAEVSDLTVAFVGDENEIAETDDEDQEQDLVI
ncbi:MAG: hypothetical protein ACK4NW_06915 [Roseinatronobacter sp.]